MGTDLNADGGSGTGLIADGGPGYTPQAVAQRDSLFPIDR